MNRPGIIDLKRCWKKTKITNEMSRLIPAKATEKWNDYGGIQKVISKKLKKLNFCQQITIHKWLKNKLGWVIYINVRPGHYLAVKNINEVENLP